jgi:hypothetical protein
MHLLVRAGVAACLTVSLLSQPVSASVGPPANVYIAGGAFTFIDRGVEWSGSIQIVHDRLHGRQNGSVYFARLGAERICDAGTPEEYVSNDYIEFSGETLAVDVNFRDDLSSVSFEIRAAGQMLTSDGCTGEIVSSRVERHSFDGKLTGRGEITTQTEDTDVELPDGQIVPGTQTTSSRAADGKLQVDRFRAVMTDVSITHAVTMPNS